MIANVRLLCYKVLVNSGCMLTIVGRLSFLLLPVKDACMHAFLFMYGLPSVHNQDIFNIPIS